MRRSRALLMIAVLGCGMVAGFQNCGSVGDPALKTQSKVFVFEDIFHYPYTSAPEVYGQVQLATSSTSAGFNDVQYIAVFGRSDGEDAVYDYEIDIVNENGYPVCPARTGTASGGQTSYADGCLSQVQSSEVHVKLKVTSAGTTHNFEKIYR